MVNFFSSWCAPCVREMPAIESVKQALDGEVTFVGVDVQDTVEDGAALIEETGITWQTARDPDGVLTVAAQVQGMPTTLLLDDDGRVLVRHTGALTEDDLAALPHETLVIWTDRNPTSPVEVGRRTAEILPNGRFELIEGAGHWPMFEQPEAFNRLVGDFLGR